MLDVDHALTHYLEAHGARAAVGVELRFFSGLTETEIAEVQGVSVAKVRRDRKFARVWLISRLAPRS